MCFGEIDCRSQLLKRSEEGGRALSTVVRECVERYARVFSEMKSMGYRPIGWGVVPSRDSSGDENRNAQFPVWGTMLERKAVTRSFNSELATALAADSIPTVSLFDSLVGSDGATRGEFFFDGVHLSQRAMPLALKELAGFLEGSEKAPTDLRRE